MRAPTGRGWTASSIATNTMCDESVTWRSPVAAFSEKTRTPTSSEVRPTYSTRARRIAISPTRTGCRKSISSIAPTVTGPRATRDAARVPAVAIQSIIRPP